MRSGFLKNLQIKCNCMFHFEIESSFLNNGVKGPVYIILGLTPFGSKV
jgi:hypothetical protein